MDVNLAVFLRYKFNVSFISELIARNASTNSCLKSLTSCITARSPSSSRVVINVL